MKFLGPPELENSNEEEITTEMLGFYPPCKIKSKESFSAIQRAKTSHCKHLIANISCEVRLLLSKKSNLFIIQF